MRPVVLAIHRNQLSPVLPRRLASPARRSRPALPCSPARSFSLAGPPHRSLPGRRRRQSRRARYRLPEPSRLAPGPERRTKTRAILTRGARSPGGTRGFAPARLRPQLRLPAGRHSTICRASSSAFCPATRANTWNWSDRRRTTSKVLTPMDPVDPRRAILVTSSDHITGVPCRPAQTERPQSCNPGVGRCCWQPTNRT